MIQCPVCYREIYSSKLKTIGDQVVCSLSCISYLYSNEKDVCDYCQRPVWKDNYYQIKGKNYCSEWCKNYIIEELNIPQDDDSIKHFTENTFIDTAPIELKNTKQLREEVLKVINDFEFDKIDDLNENENDNEKKKEKENECIQSIKKEKNYKKIEINKYKARFINENKSDSHFEKKATNIREYKSAHNLNSYLKNKKDYLSSINEDNIKNKQIMNIGNYIPKGKFSSFNNISDYWSPNGNISNNNNYNNGKSSRDKSYEINGNMIKKTILSNNKRSEIKNNNTPKKQDSNKRYSKRYQDYYNTNYYNNHYSNDYYYNSKKVNKTINDDNYNDHYIYDYNNINQYLINNSELSNRKKNYNLTSNLIGYNNYFNKNGMHINKINNPVKLNIRKNICKTCYKNIGNVKFLDRNGNCFCSDSCKTEYQKQKK